MPIVSLAAAKSCLAVAIVEVLNHFTLLDAIFDAVIGYDRIEKVPNKDRLRQMPVMRTFWHHWASLIEVRFGKTDKHGDIAQTMHWGTRWLPVHPFHFGEPITILQLSYPTPNFALIGDCALALAATMDKSGSSDSRAPHHSNDSIWTAAQNANICNRPLQSSVGVSTGLWQDVLIVIFHYHWALSIQ